MESSRPIARRGKVEVSSQTEAKNVNNSSIIGVKRGCHPKQCSEVASSPCAACNERTHSAECEELRDSELSKKFSTKKVAFLEMDFGSKCDRGCSRNYNNRRRCSEFWQYIDQYIEKQAFSEAL